MNNEKENIENENTQIDNSSIKSSKKIIKKAGYVIISFLWFIIVTCIEYVAIEIFLDSDIKEIGLEFALKNIAFIAIFNIIIVSLFQRIKIGLLISEVLFLVVGLANYFVLQFRGYGVVMMDFYSIQTAGNVADNYSYKLEKPFFIGTAVFVFLFVITLLLRKSKHKYFSLQGLLPAFGGIIIAVGFIVSINVSDYFFKDVTSLSWDHRVGMNTCGYLLYAVSNATRYSVEEPKGYSQAEADRVLGEHAGSDEEYFEPSSGKKPNIILIMNEAYSDLSVLGNISTNKSYNSFYTSLKKNTVKGYLETSVYGGYTSISEFEFLSGLSKSKIPGNPYLQYIKDDFPNLITCLKACGYEKAYAVHPYNASGYNRNRVYPLLGFNEFFDVEEFRDCKKTRGKYVSDEDDFSYVRKLYEEKEEGESLLVFNVTMQNHNPYTLNNDFDVNEKIRITSLQNETQAEEYLTCIRASDKALENMVKYFEKQDEPTVILMFGDHQPHLPDSFYEKVMGKNPSEFSIDDTFATHKVPFLIWANYDIEEKEVECTSVNYLSLLFKEAVDVPLSDFDRYLKELYKEFPVITANGYMDSKRRLYSWNAYTADTEKYKEKLDEYGRITYNYLFDVDNRKDLHYQNKDNN